MKDYLVILAGSPRGGEKTWKSMYKYVLNHLDADLAICCSNKWDQNISLFKKANYVWTFEEMDNYFDYYNENFNGSWKEYFDTGKDTGLLSSGSVHFVFKDMIRKNYLHILQQYKYIIYTRFDQYYVDYHPEIIENNIYIPHGEDYEGICDRHAAFPSELSKKFLGICEYINTSEAIRKAPIFNNCETTFKNHMKEIGLINKIIRFDRTQFTSNLKGEHTNWRVARYKVLFTKNLMIKYPGEFMMSFNNLIKKYGLLSSIIKESVLTINYLYLRFKILFGKFIPMKIKKIYKNLDS